MDEAASILLSNSELFDEKANKDSSSVSSRKQQEFVVGNLMEVLWKNYWNRAMITDIRGDKVVVQFLDQSGATVEVSGSMDSAEFDINGSHVPDGLERVQVTDIAKSYEFGSSVLVNVGKDVWNPGMVLSVDEKNILVQYFGEKGTAEQRKFPKSSDRIKLNMFAEVKDESNQERVSSLLLLLFVME